MKINQHTQGIMIILQAIFSIHRMSIRKNDISNTYTYSLNMHPILTYDKHMFIASFLTFNNILFGIRKMLDKCHPQTTDFTRQKQNRENVQFYKFLFFNKYLTNPYVHYSYSDVQKRTGCTLICTSIVRFLQVKNLGFH